jgi:cytochrome oxidase Cu insertion factor (SCO1/SenC/PrrC family)
MPGMTNGLNINDPIVVAAFRSALLHQGIAALLIFVVLVVAWVAIREWRPPGAAILPTSRAAQAETAGEPAWRQALRIGFGLLWLFDGILQAQPAMAVGLPSQVIEPSASSSPHWVQHLVNWAGTAWSYHPVEAGAAAVWIQVGIGLWLLIAARGPLSRLAGVVSVGWGLIVWVFGESFGEILAPGLSWLTGAPGGVVYYCVAGVLIALPVRYWRSPALARLLAGGTGVFLVGMALLQAWPGRGFWQGTFRGQPGSLTSMVQDMATTSQPRTLSSLVSGFGSFVGAHGFAVNLFAVIALAVLGLALASAAWPGTASPRGADPADSIDSATSDPAGSAAPRWRLVLLRVTTGALIALCLAVWVLIQDFGFFGGLGTDPNSMVPMALLALAACLAVTAAARPAQLPATTPAAVDQAAAAPVQAGQAAAAPATTAPATAAGQATAASAAAGEPPAGQATAVSAAAGDPAASQAAATTPAVPPTGLPSDAATGPAAAASAGEPARPSSSPAGEPDSRPGAAPGGPPRPPDPSPSLRTWRTRLRPVALAQSFSTAGMRTVLSASAIGVIILGAVPMAAAQAGPSAAPILAEAIDGSSAPLHTVAPSFALTDQHGRPVSLASLRGKAVLLTFLDPVCVTDCPLEAQEFRQAGVLLGADASKVELVAVNLNPLYSSTAYTQAFDRQERLAGVPNWLFLTGSPAQLRPIWRDYGVASQALPAGSMLGHSDAAFVISPTGRLREELNFDPGPGTAATQSSFATELTTAARAALGSS